MLAIVQERYGSPDRLRLREVERPVAGDDEVLVRVRAASVHPDVWHVVTGRPFILRLMGSGLLRPKYTIPGTDLAGVVESVGRNVTRFEAGDQVFGESLRGYSWAQRRHLRAIRRSAGGDAGPQARQRHVRAAAAVPTTGYIALLNLPRAKSGPGRRNGAAGGVGACTVQLAKAYGAHVTGVDHTRKLGLLRSLGADEIIDYTRDDFTRGDQRYDLIVDILGNHRFAATRRALTPDGTFVLIGHDQFGGTGHRWLGSMPHILGLVARSTFNRQLRRAGPSGLSKAEAMATLREQLESGQLAPVIDRAFPLGEAAEAIRYLAAGEPLGRVVLTV